MEINKGAVALGLFSPAMRREIIQYVMSRGNLAFDEVSRTVEEEILIQPALGFLNPKMPAHSLIRLARSLRVVLGDALAGQWDIEQYTLALTRAGSIPPDEARRIVTSEIVTADASMRSFARRLLQAIPDIPGPFDDAVAGAIGGVLNTIDAIAEPSNDSADVLYEWSRMGKVLGDLAERAMLTTEERLYERTEPATVDMTDAKEAAAQTLPWLARALLGVLGMKMESGDIDADDSRTEIGDTLDEIGSLIAEGQTLSPEQGGIGSFLKRVGRVAKKAVNIVRKVATPLASTFIPGASVALDIGKKFLPSGTDRQQVQAAGEYARKYPPLPLNATNSRVSVGDLVRLVSTLRSSGVSMG